MKKLIHEVSETSGSVYQLWAELTDCAVPAGYKTLKFSSTWTGAKNADIPYNKGQFFLPPEGIESLKELLDTK
jgi:hypothetical protein